jgi:hypothetical protein
LRLHTARAAKLAFQVAFRFEEPELLEVTASVQSPWPARVRRVGCVPVPNFNTQTPPEERDGIGMIPGYVPDTLLPQSTAKFAAQLQHAFWITLTIPADAAPGTHAVTVTLKAGDRAIALKASVVVANVTLQPRRDFPVCHWFYADAILDWYRLETWSEPFWSIAEQYMRNYAEHGSDLIYVPAFTPPLDGVKRPTQLLGVRQTGQGESAQYQFDWSLVERWIALAKSVGIERLEWVHLFTQWGVKHAIRIYEGHGLDERLLWPADTGATSPTYRRFLGQFLPALQRFLDVNRLMEVSHFHLSDEPHGDEALANYRAARDLLRELAPWMKVMDALSDLRYGQEGLTDTPIPSIKTALQFVDANIPAWCYYCCGPRGKYLNRLLDTPLAKIRMNGWLFYRWPLRGFLHWGYNYWYRSQTRQLIDPFTCSDGERWPNWAFGDCFVVYPGPAEVGPIDSIRWEVFHESLQDYALLQTLGVSREDAMFQPLRSFEEFPKTARWVEETRVGLLR